MKIPSLFRQKKNRTYNYTPRYYDERKERLDNLKKKYEVKDENEASYGKGSHLKSYRDEWLKNKKSGSDTNSRIRFFVILILLLLFTYVALRHINLDIFF